MKTLEILLKYDYIMIEESRRFLGVFTRNYKAIPALLPVYLVARIGDLANGTNVDEVLISMNWMSRRDKFGDRFQEEEVVRYYPRDSDLASMRTAITRYLEKLETTGLDTRPFINGNHQIFASGFQKWIQVFYQRTSIGFGPAQGARSSDAPKILREGHGHVEPITTSMVLHSIR